MALPKFYLDSVATAKEQYPILLKYSFNGLRLKYYTGISVDKKYFQSKCNSGNAKPIKSIAPLSEQNNNKLLDIASSAITIVSNAKGENINVKYVREELDKIFKPKVEPEAIINEDQFDFILFFEKIINDSKVGTRLIKSGKNKGKKFSHNAIKNYGTSLSAIKRYMKYNGIKILKFDQINESFYLEFKDYCFDNEEKEISTFSGYIKDIKTVMIESKAPNFDTKSFFMPDYESDTIALSLEQIDQIHNLDLSDHSKFIIEMIPERDKAGKTIFDKQGNKIMKPKKISYAVLENVRDLFLVGCYSALRFQNFNELTIDKIDDGFIRVKQIKTGNRVTIPIMQRFQKLLNKYDGGLPVGVSNQQFNRTIKHVVKLAGLIHPIKVSSTKGNKISYSEIPFNELISSHTARRSYATIMFKAGVPSLLIMSATGHKTEASFLKYIRATNEDKAILLSDMIKKLGL